MQQADIIIFNAHIVTMNPEFELIPNGHIIIKNERIASLAAGPPSESVECGKYIDARNGLVIPGLINCHTHAAMSYMRGLADDLPLMRWLEDYIFPVETQSSAEVIYWGTLLACAEMIRSGATTFCDMYLFEREVARAAREAGMRALVGEVLYDFDSPNYGSLENGFRYTKDLIDEWKDDELISVAVEPHAPYTCSPDLFKRALGVCEQHGAPMITHLSESLQEVETVKERYGKSPVHHLDSLGALTPFLIADHCVHVTDEEMDLLAERGTRIAHNPESNMKLAVGIAPIPAMLKKGLTVGLGTDGCASNNNLNMFGEMDSAAKIHKVVHNDPTVMDARTVFAMATIEAAKTLGMGDKTGSLEPGKLADIVVLDINRPHLTPAYQPYSLLVYAANGSEVTHSIIHGKLVMEQGALTTIDEERVMEKVREIGSKSLDFLKKKAIFKNT